MPEENKTTEPEDDSIQSRQGAEKSRGKKERKGISLCLSGGGYRAALFHLGVLRRLNELGILSSVTHISSVSGGSIIAAHLAERIKRWRRPGEVITRQEWDETVANPFHDLTATDIRTIPILKRLLPWNLFRQGYHTKELEKQYNSRLTRMRVVDLPEHPQFSFCATDMVFGVNWEFTRAYVGDYKIGY
ncbi:MAG TPA: patatin-like phospholipase family protein, partial [Pyrinomonadaceae bacterium]|nr:patatin-like phospholipase family protein [Pyrinomonadaceae bacterium]